jgi:hypothetical protein
MELRFYLEGQAGRVTYWIAPGRWVIPPTVFHKTRMRDEQEIARARRALARCVEEAHNAEEERRLGDGRTG